MSIQLIVGLGNPGVEYCEMRHNAGAWFVSELANRYGVVLHKESKLQGCVGIFSHTDIKLKCKLFLPATFMNLCGNAVQKFVDYYKIPLDAILVAHDDLDFPPGMVRLKLGGGDGGHKGLQSIIRYLGEKNFHRLRIGIGHPGHKSLVNDYVLTRPPLSEKKQIMLGIDRAIAIIPELLVGNFNKAQQTLHAFIDSIVDG